MMTDHHLALISSLVTDLLMALSSFCSSSTDLPVFSLCKIYHKLVRMHEVINVYFYIQ